eukprot:3785091-Rhodomonas_salina.4
MCCPGRAPNREEATWRQCAEFLQALRLPEEVFDASLDSIFPDYGPDSGWSCGELHEVSTKHSKRVVSA